MFELLYARLGTLAAVILLTGLVGLVVIVLFIIVQRVYFVVLPQWAIKKFGRTDPERLRRYLEWVVATPSLMGPAQKLMARGALRPDEGHLLGARASICRGLRGVRASSFIHARVEPPRADRVHGPLGPRVLQLRAPRLIPPVGRRGDRLG